jgi:hypothetical protein
MAQLALDDQFQVNAKGPAFRRGLSDHTTASMAWYRHVRPAVSGKETVSKPDAEAAREPVGYIQLQMNGQ